MLAYPVLLGFIHPLIAHGLTGDHDRLLRTSQFIMHSLSLFVFIFFLIKMQNKAFQTVCKRKKVLNPWSFLFFAPWVFWLGYYTLFVPFDILFMFLSFGIINAIQLKSLVRFPSRWIWQCILGYLLAAVAGIVIGLGAYLRYYKDFQGISRDFATWISISTPAGVVVAYYFRSILSKQLMIGGQAKQSAAGREKGLRGAVRSRQKERNRETEKTV